MGNTIFRRFDIIFDVSMRFTLVFSLSLYAKVVQKSKNEVSQA